MSLRRRLERGICTKKLVNTIRKRINQESVTKSRITAEITTTPNRMRARCLSNGGTAMTEVMTDARILT